MPSGHVHETINLGALACLGAGYAVARSSGYLGDSPLATGETLVMFCLSYLIGTFLITPDLDLAENSILAKRRWGLLGVLWVPYGRLFKHRGLSHSWLLGPLTRLAYLALVAYLFSLVAFAAPQLGYRVSLQADPRDSWQDLGLGALIGYYLSQWLHLIADGITPDHALKRRRRTRR